MGSNHNVGQRGKAVRFWADAASDDHRPAETVIAPAPAGEAEYVHVVSDALRAWARAKQHQAIDEYAELRHQETRSEGFPAAGPRQIPVKVGAFHVPSRYLLLVSCSFCPRIIFVTGKSERDLQLLLQSYGVDRWKDEVRCKECYAKARKPDTSNQMAVEKAIKVVMDGRAEAKRARRRALYAAKKAKGKK